MSDFATKMLERIAALEAQVRTLAEESERDAIVKRDEKALRRQGRAAAREVLEVPANLYADAGAASPPSGAAGGSLSGTYPNPVVAPAAITFAMIQNLSADVVLGSSAGGATIEITCTAAGRALIDDANAAAQRTTLGLGTSAVKDTGTTSGTVVLLDTSTGWAASNYTPRKTYSNAVPALADLGDFVCTIHDRLLALGIVQA